jgi:hypothetical protein
MRVLIFCVLTVVAAGLAPPVAAATQNGTDTATATPAGTASPTPTTTPNATATATASPTPRPELEQTPRPTPTPTATAAPTATPSRWPTISVDVTLPNGTTVTREVRAYGGEVDLSGLPDGSNVTLPAGRLPEVDRVRLPNGTARGAQDLLGRAAGSAGNMTVNVSSLPGSRSTATATATPDRVERVSGKRRDPNTTYVGAVSPTLRIVSFSYDKQNEQMTILFESDTPDRVLVRDSLHEIRSRGFTALPEGRTTNVAPGRTRITVDASPVNGDARVYIGSSNGRGYLSTGMESDSPFEKTSSTAGWLGGFSTLAVMSIAAAHRQLAKDARPVEEVEP